MKYFFIVLTCLLLVGCGLPRKSWGTAGSADAFKFTITESQTGSLTPELVAGGGAHAMLFQKAYSAEEVYPSMFAYSRRKSMWGMFSGNVGAGNVSCVYITGSNETPEQTLKILEKLDSLVNSQPTAEPEEVKRE